MILGHFRLNPIEVNAFIYGCPRTREALLVDCGDFDPRLPEFVEAQGLRLTTIFITHEHWDHVQALPAAAKYFGAQVVSAIADPAGVAGVRVMTPGETVDVGDLTGRVVDTSGHTATGLSLIFPELVFSGDALFAGSVGGTTTPEDHARQLDNIRRNLFTLPDDTIVCPGHGPCSTIGIERRFNPFFV
jgi:glyoxylase-like metal-dependent hydrolase (beta-lactamase superfamily II)